MAVKVIHVSDVSDRQGSKDELGRLVVLEHPDIGEPATLEIFPEEFAGIQTAERIVRVEWTPPGARNAQVLTVSQEAFDALAKGTDMRAVLLEAITAQHQQQGRAPAPTRRRRGRAGSTRKADYSSAEHAGEPHRGRITDAEKAYVREHLAAVNARLRAAGKREIDASDPTMRDRYGLG